VGVDQLCCGGWRFDRPRVLRAAPSTPRFISLFFSLGKKVLLL
jgi:hypothetical protein